MQIIHVEQDNEKHMQLLTDFISEDLGQSFRYYQKRSIDVVKNHLLTLLLTDKTKAIGYAHIDKDDNKMWFGICILNEYRGLGYGNMILKHITSLNYRPLWLSVDSDNQRAQHLYKKFGFNVVQGFSNNPNIIFMKLL